MRWHLTVTCFFDQLLANERRPVAAFAHSRLISAMHKNSEKKDDRQRNAQHPKQSASSETHG
jgi:hypothetical protein